jgi:thiosulfate/3-mercaptopyruvate sulfurtransferase
VTGPLIGTDELADLVDGGASPVLLDVRWELATGPDPAAFRAGHIPGAAFVDLDRDLAGPPGDGGRHPLPAPEAFEAVMRRAGVSAERLVVAYDACASMVAARAWWLLRYFGHARAAVLDGGLAGWRASGRALETGPAAMAAPGTFTARPGGMAVVDATAAARLAREGVLIDARIPARYDGLEEPVDPVAGHIPGARNRLTSLNTGADGRFLPPAQLRQAFDELGVRDGAPVAAYCGSGVNAAHEVLALALAGFDGAALYPGSWSEWIQDPGRPIAGASGAGARQSRPPGRSST